MRHDKTNHRLVQSALIRVAADIGIDYARVKTLFIEGNEDITVLFWRSFYERNPYKATGVDYCQTCRKFHLGFVKPLLPWSIENHRLM